MSAGRDRLIRQREYCERVGVPFDTVTKQIQQGRCDVTPCAIRPYRWRADDVDRWIRTTTLPAARKQRADRKKREAADRALRLVEPAAS